MNNIFDIKRFGKYFVYDLNNLRKRFGISVGILAIMPLVVYFFMGVTKTLFEKSPWSVDSVACAVSANIIAILIMVITFPVKTYGFITEKKSGSSWLLLPASTFEKFLSMLIISVIVVPCIVVLGNYLSNVMLALCDSNYTNVLNRFFTQKLDWSDPSIKVVGNGLPLIIIGITQGILFFLLGAVFFKRAKVAKTFLVSFVSSILLTVVLFFIFRDKADDLGKALEQFAYMNFGRFVNLLNFFINTMIIFGYVVLGGGLFWRLKTIRQ